LEQKEQSIWLVIPRFFKVNMEQLVLVSSIESYPTNKKSVLAYADGNTIDSVEYFDADDWLI
jgi:hypothetical protein